MEFSVSAYDGFSNPSYLFRQPCDFCAILVAAAGEAEHDDVGLWPTCRDAHCLDNPMGSFQSWDDPFEPAANAESFQCTGVVDARVADTLLIFPVTVFGPDARIVESRGN